VRFQKLITFAKPGNPGIKFKGPFEKMMKALSIPKTVREDLGITEEAAGDQSILSNRIVGDLISEEDSKKKSEDEEEDRSKRPSEEQRQVTEAKLVRALIADGKYHLVPSFFRTLIYLKKIKKEFAVVFRNYSALDLQNAVAEFNQFCKGEHPCYNGKNGTSLVKFDGSKGTKELRLKDKNQRVNWFKDGEQFRANRLVLGAKNRVSSSLTYCFFRRLKVKPPMTTTSAWLKRAKSRSSRRASISIRIFSRL
jgi:hypothetical protein